MRHFGPETGGGCPRCVPVLTDLPGRAPSAAQKKTLPRDFPSCSNPRDSPTTPPSPPIRGNKRVVATPTLFQPGPFRGGRENTYATALRPVAEVETPRRLSKTIVPVAVTPTRALRFTLGRYSLSVYAFWDGTLFFAHEYFIVH